MRGIYDKEKRKGTSKFCLRKITAALLSIALVFGIIPVLTPLVQVNAAETAEVRSANVYQDDGSIPGIIQPGILSNALEYWNGEYVYFGTYNGEPVKYRVLASSTTDFNTSPTMFLDCDSVLETSYDFDSASNKWADSDIKRFLNSEKAADGSYDYSSTGFLTTAFTSVEQSAIAESTNTSHQSLLNPNGYSTAYGYAPLTGEKIFFLDAKEAANRDFGYLNTVGTSYSRRKLTNGGTNTYSYWWLRSYVTTNSTSAYYANASGACQSSGVSAVSNIGISPALNLDLSAVSFTFVSKMNKQASFSATSKYTTPVRQTSATRKKEWNLTLAGGDGFQAARTGTGNVTWGDTVYVNVSSVGTPYQDVTYTQLSAMLVDGNGTVAAFGQIKPDATAGAATLIIPDGTPEGDYTLKVFAEDVNSTSTLNLTDYASNMADIPLKVVAPISQVDVTGIEQPESGQPLDTTAVCSTLHVATTTPEVSYTIGQTTVSGSANYNTEYTASVTLTSEEGYAFAGNNLTATINGDEAEAVKNLDGTVTITYTFPATAKAKLVDIQQPSIIAGLPNGTALADIDLPDVVAIETEDNTVTSAEVTWDLGGVTGYDPNLLAPQQTFYINGTVNLPEEIDSDGKSLNISISVTVKEADTVAAPIAGVAAGTYMGNQSVTLSSATAGVEIYYTTDGSTPTTGSTKYTGAVTIAGAKDTSVTTTLKAIAVKSGMQNSPVSTYVYTINLPLETVAVTDITEPSAGQALDTEAVCNTPGVATITPNVGYTIGNTSVSGNARYNAEHTATVILKPSAGYMFADQVTATINGNQAAAVKNLDGTLTVTYTFPATVKAKLLSIPPSTLTGVANGTALGDIPLPQTVTIVTEDSSVTSAMVTWDISSVTGYDPTLMTEQTFTVNGTVTLPEDIDQDGKSLDAIITVTVAEAGTVATPNVDVPEGTYTSNQIVSLSSATKGATIYYTTDGSEPTEASEVFTEPINITGVKEQSIITVIKAMAVCAGMFDSETATFTYTINIPLDTYTITYDANGGSGNMDAGTATEGQAFLLPAGNFEPPEGKQFKEWAVGSPDGSTVGAGENYLFTEPTTVYAIWEDAPHIHRFGEEWYSDSTNHWHECECGERSEEGVHTEDAGVITKEPTETESGVKTYSCSICGYTMRIEEIPAIGENIETKPEERPVTGEIFAAGIEEEPESAAGIEENPANSKNPAAEIEEIKTAEIKGETPETGDNAPDSMLILCMLFSGMFLIDLAVKRKRF